MYLVNHSSSLNSKHFSIKVMRKSVTPNTKLSNVVCYSCVRCVICGLSTIMKDYIWEGRHVLLFGSRPTLQFLFHDIAKKKIFKEVQTANAYYKITCHRIELGIWFSISMHFEIDVQHRLYRYFILHKSRCLLIKNFSHQKKWFILPYLCKLPSISFIFDASSLSIMHQIGTCVSICPFFGTIKKGEEKIKW